MKVAIFHPIFSTIGGGEKVVLIISNLLIKHGYNVKIFTLSDQEQYIRKSEIIFGLKMKSDIEYMKKPNFFQLKNKYFLYYPFYSIFDKKTKDYDVRIATQGTPDLPANVVYIQTNMYNRKVLRFRKLLRLYYGIKGNPKIVISVSSYTAKTIKDVYGLDSLVIHPQLM
jgi:hypothetical protein